MEEISTKREGKREIHPNSLKALKSTQFRKGERRLNQGHPLGQPNYTTMRDRAIRLLAKQNGKTPLEIEDEINANALLEARKGNFQFYKDDKDRTYGQATQKTELSGVDGKDLISSDIIEKKAEEAIKKFLNK